MSRALLDGEAVALRAEVTWPLPPLPVAAEGAYTVRVTDRSVEPADGEAVLRPPTLVVGMGASKGAPVEEVLALVESALREAGLSAASVAELATVDAKAGEPGLVEAARRLGVRPKPRRRLDLEPDTVERDLVKLVLTVVELLRQLMERQAVRRFDEGDLTEEQEERVGLTLMLLEDRMAELRNRYGLRPEDLNLDLGPLGPLLPRD